MTWPPWSAGSREEPLYADDDPRSEFFPTDEAIEQASDVREDAESKWLSYEGIHDAILDEDGGPL